MEEMMKKYNNYFWEHRITKEKDTWEGTISDKKLSKKSIFLQIGMYHYVDMHNSWACHSKVESIKGFLIYVLIPTIIHSIIADGEERGINYAVENPYLLLDELRDDIKKEYEEDLAKVYNILNKFDEIPTDNKQESIEYMKELSDEFNEIWTETEMNFYFLIFDSPEEIVKDLIEVYEEENMLEELEDQSGLTVEELKNMADNIWDNEFTRKRFMDILNNKLYYATW